MISHKEMKDGFITLISVLIVGAIGVTVAASVLLLGLGLSQTIFVMDQSKTARVLVDACVEEGLQKIRDSKSFEGTGNLSVDQGSCSYVVTKLSGDNRIINASGTVGTIIRKTRVTIDKINPKINVTSWQEVADL